MIRCGLLGTPSGPITDNSPLRYTIRAAASTSAVKNVPEDVPDRP